MNRKVILICTIVISIFACGSVLENIERNNEIKEIAESLQINLPSYRFIHYFSDGDIWDYTSCYVIKFSKPLNNDNISQFKNIIDDVRKNFIFTVTKGRSERDFVWTKRLMGFFGLSTTNVNDIEILYKTDLTYYGKIINQIDPEKVIYFGFNTSSNIAVIKIIHM